jgi:hypothetical protein
MSGGDGVYTLQVSIIRCPGDSGPASTDDGSLLRPMPPLGWGAHDPHLPPQLAEDPVGAAPGPRAGEAAMRIYLAARYDRRHEMRDVARRLRAAGHAITSIWIEGLHEGVCSSAPP